MPLILRVPLPVYGNFTFTDVNVLRIGDGGKLPGITATVQMTLKKKEILPLIDLSFIIPDKDKS